MWSWIAGAVGQIPPGFPEKVELPRPFLYQIDGPFWIWVIRGVLTAGLILCLWYGCSRPAARPKHHASSPGPHPPETGREKEKK